MHFDNIPAELKALPNWVGFRVWWDEKEKKYKKMPIDIRATVATKRADPTVWKDVPAESNNPATWCDFTTAADWLKAKKPHKKNKWHIGFAFDGSGICGIDLDHCISADGGISEFAKGILAEVPSYTEYSPSGTGLHILAKCGKAFSGGGINREEIEVYQSGRFFTVTGNRYENSPEAIIDCTEAVLGVYNRFNSTPNGTVCDVSGVGDTVEEIGDCKTTAAVGAPKATRGVADISDVELIERARNSKNGSKFDALWRGDFSGYKSQSEADMALCLSLAFWTGNDASRVDGLFRQSGLMRPKWDERHGNMTYGQKTVAEALSKPHDIYKPKEKKEKTKAKAEAGSVVFVRNNSYCVYRGDDVKMLTNFIVEPFEIVTFENDSRIAGKLTNARGEATGRSFRISDFNSVSAFRDAICRNDMNFIVTCSDTELQYIKDYISRLPCAVKRGYKGVGIEFVEPTEGGMYKPVFVCKDGAFGKGWERCDEVVQVSGSENIPCGIAGALSLDDADLNCCGKHYVNYNEKPKTLSILCFAAACFIKPHLKRHGVKFPNLILYGEHGSGKSTTYKQFLCPFFSTGGAPPISKMTGFTFLSKAASSNCIPMAFDEYKPSTLSKPVANEIHNAMRDAYDGEHGERGRADQTVRQYEIAAPLIVMGEEAPFEPAIRERSIILQFSKADIAGRKEYAAKLAALSTQSVAFGKALTQSFGKTVLLTALGLSSHKVKTAYDEAVSAIRDTLDPRIINNIAVLLTGEWLLEQACLAVGTTFKAAFGVERESVMHEVVKAVKDYTLDGVENSKGVVENSFEIIDRMVPSVLKSGYHFRLCDDRNKIAVNFKRIYDEFTKYVKDKAIAGEFVDFNNFKAQLRKKAYFAKYGTARFKSDVCGQNDGEPEGCYILDILKLRAACDVGNILSQLRWSPPPPPEQKQGTLFDEAG
ncbi:MAG: hypothetical protein LBT55_00350 [Clostridiaceae bacterium]|jgi:hypothetical protein|nr:hypothetical protein [Clostridiaceae bacterium]